VNRRDPAAPRLPAPANSIPGSRRPGNRGRAPRRGGRPRRRRGREARVSHRPARGRERAGRSPAMGSRASQPPGAPLAAGPRPRSPASMRSPQRARPPRWRRTESRVFHVSRSDYPAATPARPLSRRRRTKKGPAEVKPHTEPFRGQVVDVRRIEERRTHCKGFNDKIREIFASFSERSAGRLAGVRSGP